MLPLATLAALFAYSEFDALGADLKEVLRERKMIPDCLVFLICTGQIKDYNTLNSHITEIIPCLPAGISSTSRSTPTTPAKRKIVSSLGSPSGTNTIMLDKRWVKDTEGIWTRDSE
ncbi:MAG: hypothetical protein CMP27_00020 [Roseibacillus sp.]|nr:hypothetical protein [Roseibacillus sp.]